MALSFELDATFDGRQWLLNIGQRGPGAEHWLWRNEDLVQIGAWSGHQIQRADISNSISLVTVYDGKTLSLYLDGELRASQTMTLNIEQNNMDIGVKAKEEAFGEAFSGCIGGVDLYREALSQQQIQQAVQNVETAVQSALPPPDEYRTESHTQCIKESTTYFGAPLLNSPHSVVMSLSFELDATFDG